MHPRHQKSKSPAEFKAAFEKIHDEAITIHNKMIANFESRDMAVALELGQRQIDLLDEMSANLPPSSSSVVKVGYEGAIIEFPSIDNVAEWITDEIY